MSGTITFHADYNDAAKTAAECEGLGEVQVMVHGLGWVVIVWQNEGQGTKKGLRSILIRTEEIMKSENVEIIIRNAIHAIEQYRILYPTDNVLVARSIERARIDLLEQNLTRIYKAQRWLQYLLQAIDATQQDEGGRQGLPCYVKRPARGAKV